MEISPIRLIRRIKNGLEIPGLKEALIKILQDFHLQISLLEGCKEILDGDSGELAGRLARCQSSGFFMTGKSSSPHSHDGNADRGVIQARRRAMSVWNLYMTIDRRQSFCSCVDMSFMGLV